MDILLTIVLVILALIFRKSKLVTVLIFLFLWTLWGWNAWNGDYEGYENIYLNSLNYSQRLGFSVEKGYQTINHFFIYNLKLSYQSFLKVYSFIILAINCGIILRFSKFPALNSLFYIFIFIMEFVFLRNYLTDTLLFVALVLVIKNVRYNKLWFGLIVALCSTIHLTSVVFFIFFFALFTNKVINIKKALFFFLALMIGSALLLDNILPFLSMSYASRLDLYKSGEFLPLISLFHLGLVLFMYHFINTLLFNKKNDISPELRRVYTIVLNVNIISLFYLSLYYHVPYFSRIIKFLLAFDILFFINAYYFVYAPVIKKKINLMAIGMITFLLLFFSTTTFSHTLIPLYKCNYIWGNEYYSPPVYY